jgi:hypothetical protein
LTRFPPSGNLDVKVPNARTPAGLDKNRSRTVAAARCVRIGVDTGGSSPARAGVLLQGMQRQMRVLSQGPRSRPGRRSDGGEPGRLPRFVRMRESPRRPVERIVASRRLANRGAPAAARRVRGFRHDSPGGHCHLHGRALPASTSSLTGLPKNAKVEIRASQSFLRRRAPQAGVSVCFQYDKHFSGVPLLC